MTILTRVAVVRLNQSGGPVAHALIDEADAELVGQWRWTLNNNGYAWRSTGNGRHVYLHRLIGGGVRGDGMYVDHINRDRLDNRRANLRLVTPAQGAQNKPANRGRFRGVNWDKHRGKWTAAAQLDGRMYHLGRYASEEEADRVVRAWRREHMPFSEEASA